MIVKTAISGIPCYAGMNAALVAVLTRDDAGLYAVYVGIIDKSVAELHADVAEFSRAYTWIAASGSKLNWKKATEYFSIEEKEYRA